MVTDRKYIFYVIASTLTNHSATTGLSRMIPRSLNEITEADIEQLKAAGIQEGQIH